ncbi:MAG TPA: flagellar biosynthesis protein FlhF, partial [Polyangia bacterium]|nr:flagellar biosynthesis protein FlhF [Polyangia bacterium]
QGGLFTKPQIEVTAASGERPAPKAERVTENDVAALRRVMEDVRRSLHKKSDGVGGDRTPGHELSADARRVFRHLLNRGIEDGVARELLDQALTAGAEGVAEISRGVVKALGRQLQAAPAPWSAEARRTIALVGPTGVGKTTAIAKIAARALLETQFKVGLITVDTYRVGASDQLARYGKIMGVPTYVARDRAGLAEAVDRTRDADLVLIDTAGRSDAASIEAQMALVTSAPNVQLHLVMSLATGARELAGVARRYKSFNPERLIFTKLDEAEGPAGALAASAVLPRAVSCLCDGQRVPEDIHAVTDTELVSRLMGISREGILSTSNGNNREALRGPGQ